ncbi:DUF6927 domain-containing protein [Novosphingobium gossypii]|uniref:DUF6927 domain-containing protein n=1 Tax=Novosphingobium gossypii TaxID=1604774 RepID=UPI003D1C202C
MGWLSMTRSGMGDTPTPKAYLDKQFTWVRETVEGAPLHGCRVLASACSKHYYAAVQSYDERGAGEVFGVVCLVRWNLRAADGYVFSYKDMIETAGPYEADCPLKILALLSPSDNPVALDWRRRCHEALLRRKRPVPDGALIRFATAITFTDGSSHQIMRVRREKNRIVLSPRDGYGCYTVSRLFDRAFEIVREPKVMPTIFPKGV